MKEKILAVTLAIIMLLGTVPGAAVEGESTIPTEPRESVTENEEESEGDESSLELPGESLRQVEDADSELQETPLTGESGELMESTHAPDNVLQATPSAEPLLPNQQLPEKNEILPQDAIFPMDQEPLGNPISSFSVPETTVDVDSRYDYQGIFDLNNTRYDGRIWTDKTVYDKNMEFYGNVHEIGEEEINNHLGRVEVRLEEDEDFLVSYSALASTTTVLSETESPIDLVFVLDMSPMINSEAGKLASMLTAVETATAAMMELNPNNRVAIVAYSSQAEVLLPLGRYTLVDMDPGHGQPSQATTVKCTYLKEDSDQTSSTTFTVSYQNATPVNKYTQMGIYTGMKMLQDIPEGDLTVQIGEDTIRRQPALILMSEGEPKIASTEIENPTQSTVQADGTIDTNGEDGLSASYNSREIFTDRVEIKRNAGLPDARAGSNSSRHAQTFATILTAAYMKRQVAEHYHTDAAQIYTIGINPSSANAPELAQVVLDPRNYLETNADFAGYVNSYTGADESTELPNAGAAGMSMTTFRNTCSLTAQDLKYNDGYYEVIGSGSEINWEGVFDLVLSQVTSNTAKVPTLVDRTDVHGNQSGWLSYSDPLGEYMELKAVKALIINDVIYRADRITQQENRYIVDGTATNPVYGTYSLSDIVISVSEDAGMQTLHVDIPAALLPLRQTTVVENVDGQVINYTHNSAYPFRLVYSVGLKKGVLNSDGSVNTGPDGVSDAYIANHTADGHVQFYAGYYSAEEQPGQFEFDDKTVGNAFVAYTPALNNPFYYVDEDTLLYTDKECMFPAKGPYSADTPYYFKAVYYQQVENSEASEIKAVRTSVIISRPAGSIPSDATKEVEKNGETYLYLAEGKPRLGNLADFRREKGGENNTGTADIYLYLYYVGQNQDAHDFRIYHGNNGCLSAPLPDGTLSVTKVVENNAQEEISRFQFTIDLPSDPMIPGVAWDSGTGTGTFSLGAGETMLLTLDYNTPWSIRETTDFSDYEDHWTTTVAATPETSAVIDPDALSASGTMTPDGTSVTFTSIHASHTGTLIIDKKTAGDAADSGTNVFAFTLMYGAVGTGSAESKPFTLSDRQSQSFIIPAGSWWTVTETDPGEHWSAVTHVDGGSFSEGRTVSGIMGDGVTQQLTFTNTYTAPGSLVVSKQVEGDNSGSAYEFIVKIGSNEEETLTLSKGNGYIYTYDNLADGTPWTVTEVSALAEGWTTTANGASSQTVSGVIESGKASAASFINAAPGMLIVTKEVEGSDKSGTFSFKLTYGSHSQVFTLENGGSQQFPLPAGTEYTITEASGTGWATTVNGVETNSATGTIFAGAKTTETFVNTYVGTPEKPDLSPTPNPDPGLKPNPAPDPDPNPGDSIAADDVILHYESSGGTKYEDELYRENTVVQLDKVPIRAGYTFTGWYADAELTERIVQIRMTSDKTVYAGWKVTGIPDWLNGTDHFAYVIGYSDGTVRPLDHITRAEVSTIIFRLLDPAIRDANLTADNSFGDVNEGMWCHTAISTLARLGIVHGRTSEFFDPDAPITRGEFAAICARFDDSAIQAGSSFTDISGYWAEEEIERAATLGWIRGYNDGSFRPSNLITRAEAMNMINRMLQRLPENEEDLLPDMNVWPDNQPGDWHYLAVQEATNSHTFNRKNDGVHEEWTAMATNPDWKQYE